MLKKNLSLPMQLVITAAFTIVVALLFALSLMTTGGIITLAIILLVPYICLEAILLWVNIKTLTKKEALISASIARALALFYCFALFIALTYPVSILFIRTLLILIAMIALDMLIVKILLQWRGTRIAYHAVLVPSLLTSVSVMILFIYVYWALATGFGSGFGL